LRLPVGRNGQASVVLCVEQKYDAEIQRLLIALQATARFCRTGGEALAMARAQPLACIITPLEMPDMTARALIDTLRTTAPGLPLIVVVDNPAVSEAVTVMRSGAHAVVDGGKLSSGLLLHLAPLLRNP
jgi:CheY-like chemotaxis protein